MLTALLAFFMPGFLGVPFRRMLGAQIASDSKIGIFALVMVKNLKLASGARISSLAVVKADRLDLGENAVIKGPSIVKASQVSLGAYSSISPLAVINAPLMTGADFLMGEHSQIFPYCWLEPGEGIEIGNQVGVGGHTLIFTHGSWTNYLEGGPISFGKVKIEDGVWLPWRVFILPGVTIGANAIVAAHSTVSKSVPARALIGGAPAKIIKEEFVVKPQSQERKRRLEELLNAFPVFMGRKGKTIRELTFSIADSEDLRMTGYGASFDFEKLTFTNPKSSELVQDFVDFIRRYGIRMSELR